MYYISGNAKTSRKQAKAFYTATKNMVYQRQLKDYTTCSCYNHEVRL